MYLVAAVILVAVISDVQAADGLSLYTYELPSKFTEGVAEMPIDRAENAWTIWYDTDQVLYQGPPGISILAKLTFGALCYKVSAGLTKPCILVQHIARSISKV